MGLYLCVFDGDEEIEGVEVGPYLDFDIFRDCITRQLEGGHAGARFPTLTLHSDCDGEWSPSQARELEKELISIGDEFRRRPHIPIRSDWQNDVLKDHGLQINNLYDRFFDVNGQPLLEGLTILARLSQERNLPILFQ